jgi:predicted AlkP superfamily pyrophosphatase or phosphodiesterase
MTQGRWHLKFQRFALLVALVLIAVRPVCGQASKDDSEQKPAAPKRPKLVVMIVVDQLRADYVDRFQGQWSGGLKRLLQDGAWFRNSAYPYASTETCVGHATVSTGALPMNHGMVTNAWWDRESHAMVTCTADPNAKNMAYGGGTAKGGDSAWRMLVPSFAEELKFQAGSGTRIVTFSLKARASITMAGHKADAVTWLDSSTASWTTSSAYQTQPFIEEFVKAHPISQDYGKTWSLSLAPAKYLYDGKNVGASTVEGWTDEFPHSLRGKDGAGKPDTAFYYQWGTSPFADTYLTQMAETAVDALGLGESAAIDFLGVSYSSVDYVGHTFGPRSWAVQDVLIRLDRDLDELFKHLDQKVGQGNYVVALTGDHGVAPIPADLQREGFDTGVLSLPALKDRMEKALEPFKYANPAVARIAGNEVYLSPGVYEQLKHDPAAKKALTDAVLNMPGVAAMFYADEVGEARKAFSDARTAVELSYVRGRSGDLYVLQRPYWLMESSAEASKRATGAGHGSPYYYDQRVPILLMGVGIRHGEYFEVATPADIAPTFAALTGITLSTHDGRVLSEALQKAVAPGDR